MTTQTKPLLSVRNLQTHFPLDEGTVIAVGGASFDLYPGQTLGVVGESGCGKSVTARSILRILDKPGRIVSGEILLQRGDNGAGEVIDLAELDPDGLTMRTIRGGDVASGGIQTGGASHCHRSLVPSRHPVARTAG